MNLRKSEEVFLWDGEPRELLAWLAKHRKTGRVVLTLNQGGVRKPVEWREHQPREKVSTNA